MPARASGAQALAYLIDLPPGAPPLRPHAPDAVRRWVVVVSARRDVTSGLQTVRFTPL